MSRPSRDEAVEAARAAYWAEGSRITLMDAARANGLSHTTLLREFRTRGIPVRKGGSGEWHRRGHAKELQALADAGQEKCGNVRCYRPKVPGKSKCQACRDSYVRYYQRISAERAQANRAERVDCESEPRDYSNDGRPRCRCGLRLPCNDCIPTITEIAGQRRYEGNI